jgi:hypothetical protein
MVAIDSAGRNAGTAAAVVYAEEQRRAERDPGGAYAVKLAESRGELDVWRVGGTCIAVICKQCDQLRGVAITSQIVTCPARLK